MKNMNLAAIIARKIRLTLNVHIKMFDRMGFLPVFMNRFFDCGG